MSSDFFDRATITVRGGTGGDGMATFRREKYVPRGGPDGGDGGRGGNVYLIADTHLNTLLFFQRNRKFAAENGSNGGTSRRHGRNGEDVYVRVPPGTVVRTTIDGEPYEIDLEAPGMQLLAAKGGKGGLGNVHFTTSSQQAPRIAELGEPGEALELELELKLLADVGLVGFPNAGKSTLLSMVSAAQPKIANYPFTTLQPNLGVVEVGDLTFVMADIPGLIEGAHRGVGLGFDFLRHVERTRMLLHLVDAAATDGRDPLDDYIKIGDELRLYQPELAERPRIVVLNKIDVPEAAEHLPGLRQAAQAQGFRVFEISAATRDGVDALIQHVAAQLAEMPAPSRQRREETINWPTPIVDPNLYTIEREGETIWRVRGKRIERLIAMTNFAQHESLYRIQRVLAASGISDSLVRAGVEEGHVVRIEKAELVWTDEY